MVSPTAMKVMKFRKPLICHGQSMNIGMANRNFHNSLGIHGHEFDNPLDPHKGEPHGTPGN